MKKIDLVTLDPKVVDFIKKPESIEKNILYNQFIKNNFYRESNIIIKEDGTIHYGSNTFKVSKGKKFFLKKQQIEGFTVEPKGRMKIWYGRNINSIVNFSEILKALNKEWVKPPYLEFITPSIMGKIFVNKITNPHDLFKSIIKMYRTECSISKLIKLVEDKKINKYLLLRGISTSRNLDHYLDFLNRNSKNEIIPMHLIQDIMNDSNILERKINYKWSYKRFLLEHKKWTREIIERSSGFISTEPFSWVNRYEGISNQQIKLITNENELYAEGKIMRHCVYTSYLNSVVIHNYIVFHINDDTEYGATLGVFTPNSSHAFHNNKNKFSISQLYSFENNPASDLAKKISNELIEILNNNYLK